MTALIGFSLHTGHWLLLILTLPTQPLQKWLPQHVVRNGSRTTDKQIVHSKSFDGDVTKAIAASFQASVAAILHSMRDHRLRSLNNLWRDSSTMKPLSAPKNYVD